MYIINFYTVQGSIAKFYKHFQILLVIIGQIFCCIKLLSRILVYQFNSFIAQNSFFVKFNTQKNFYQIHSECITTISMVLFE